MARFDNFIEMFNNERPHGALGMKCPAAVYQPSTRAYHALPDIDYNFNTEYGNYSGGIVNVVTKSGGNDYHGTAFANSCATPPSTQRISFLRNAAFTGKISSAAHSADL